MTISTRQKGNQAETSGCEYLRENGFRIIDRNVFNRFGEIDIIAEKNGVLHFIEVKSASTFEQAVNNLTTAKLQKLTRTIQTYLQKNHYDGDYCIDALIVTPEQIEMIENIGI